MVARAELLPLAIPGAETDGRRTLDRIVRRVRARVAPLGLTIHTVRASGFLLEMGVLPD